MDKNAIKKYAVWARRELISRVSQKAHQYGITDKDIVPATAASVNGVVLSNDEMKQRKALINQINKKGYEQVMEEVAYTWLNRFSALRFMEVNGYLPSHVRVFTDENNNFKPQILAEAINLELDGIDMERVYALKDANDDDALFKYLVIVQCNALNPILPGMFQRIADYTELLFPDNLLRNGSAIQQMVELIPEDDWKDQVQIIGWLYQYYSSEKKDDVFAALKKNVKITKENIPAATQLFTPDWIVRYMVENSLGRLWVEGHPNDALKSEWKYYLDETEQEPEVQAQLAEIRKGYAGITPEQIKCIDPCVGSGHILTYIFDILMQIYEIYGYTTRDAVRSIIENNLYGLDIDNRAAQLAYFSVMMTAVRYDKRFLIRKDENDEPDVPQPHVHAIIESNAIGGSYKQEMGDFLASKEHRETLNYLLDAFIDAKEYGSLLKLEDRNYEGLLEAWKYTSAQTVENADVALWYSAVEHIIPVLIEQAIILTQKYDVVVTNPPYMAVSNADANLQDYVKKNYPDSKGDLSTCFMEKCAQFCNEHGYYAMINIPVWMFLSSYEKLRQKMLTQNMISSMVHPGRGIFGSDFGTTAFVISKKHISQYYGTYRRLFDKQGEVETIDEREQAFLSGKGAYSAQQENFTKIPGSPVAYWVSKEFTKTFAEAQRIGEFFRVSEGIKTGDNDRFLRLWHEVEGNRFSFAQGDKQYKWYPHHKGGDYRRWYGNLWYVVNWESNGAEIRQNPKSGLQGKDMYFAPNLGWSKISSKDNPVRYYPGNILFDSMAPSITGKGHLVYTLGLLNTKVAYHFLHILNPTLALQVGDMREMPILIKSEERVAYFVNNCIDLSRTDWDSYETSWDFKKHPLV